MNKATSLLAVIGLIALLTGSVMADSTWTGAGKDGDWANPANWDGDGVPQPPTFVYFNGATGPTKNTAPGTAYAREIHMTAPTDIGINVDWCGWGGTGLLSAEAPGSYSVGHVGSLQAFNVVEGATLTTTGVYNFQFTGLGTLIVNNTWNSQISMAGGTLDLNTASDLYSFYNGLFLGNTEWGINNLVTGFGTIKSTSGSLIHLMDTAHSNLAWTGTIDDSPVSLYNGPGTYDLTGITLKATTYTNKYQINFGNPVEQYTIDGNASKYFLVAGDASGNPSVVKNVTLTGQGNMLIHAGGMFNGGINYFQPGATLALDGATINMTHLGVDGNLAFSGSVSTMKLSIVGTGAVGGTDYSELVVRQTRRDDGGINANDGILTGLENVELIVDVTPGLDYKGLVMTIVSCVNDLTLANTFGKVTFTNKYVGTLTYTGTTGGAGVSSWGAVLLSDLKLAQVDIPGDANHSGLVDQDDYKLWYDNYGTGTTWEQGNFKGSGVTDQDDYKTWYDNYGVGTAGGAVPEPATMALLAMGGLAMLRRNKK